MACPDCGYVNPPGSRFCGACGTSVLGTDTCASCGADNPAGQRFCNACGNALEPGAEATPPGAQLVRERRPETPAHIAERIRAEREALVGERKQVTVLFADVMSSMELAERTDPEAWREIMDRFFALLSQGVHRFEGTVDKFTGDGIMALFGAPLAQEDHARRACYAALHLRDELAGYASELRRKHGLSFSVRIGLNSGEVVVGSIGEDLSLSYTAIGHTVGLAQRMEQLAEPGKVYLTKYTGRLVEGFVELDDLGEFEVKGVSHPLQLFELAGVGSARTTLEASRSRGLSRFVGRESEIEALEAALERARGGNGQVVGVVGEPGVGKSRLCHEFAERCRGHGIPIYRAAGLAHARAVPLLPALELMRGYFGIEDKDSDRLAREKVAGRLLLLDEKIAADVPLVFDFLGIPDPERPGPSSDPDAKKRQLVGLLKRLVQAEAEREPGVNLIEDLHWLDPSSNEMLSWLVDAVAGSRTLVLVNFRPEYSAEWMRKSHYQQLPLVPLGEDAIGELLADLLGSDPSLDGLAELVQERTGGNPFFVEEVVNSLSESGALSGGPGAYRLAAPIEALAVPATVQAVLAARIDRLPEGAKAILQAASVLGREFRVPVLRRVAGVGDEELEQCLRALRDGEFVYEQEVYPETVYTFKHPLTQEVASGTLLAERRRRFHAEAARVLAELEPERADERAALIAEHWEAAGEALEASRWHARAAAWAGFKDPVPSLRHWQRVRELVEELPESDERDSLGLSSRLFTLQFGWRLGIGEDEAETLFDKGVEIARRRDDRTMLALLHTIYSTVLLTRGRVERAVELVRQSLRLADETGDPGLRIAMRTGGSYALFTRGLLSEAIDAAEKGIEIGREDPTAGAGLGLTSPYAFCVMFHAGLIANAGRVEEAGRELERAADIAREQDDLETETWSHANHTIVAWLRGDPKLALAHGRRGVELAERIGDVFTRAFMRSWLGTAHVTAGEWREGIAEIEAAMELSGSAQSGREVEPWRLAWLGDACLGAGESRRALEVTERAVALARERRTMGSLPFAMVNYGRALTAAQGRDGAPDAHATLAEAVELGERTGMRSTLPFAQLGFAEVAEVEGDAAALERALREAERLFLEIGSPRRAEQAAERLSGAAA